MKPKFQADADIDPDIGIAAAADRVLISGDLKTMSGHFKQFIAGNDSPGLLLVPPTRSIGAVIEGLIEVWLDWPAEEMRNQVRWLP